MTASQKQELRAISTHTLRGERDGVKGDTGEQGPHFNSHAPWGA